MSHLPGGQGTSAAYSNLTPGLYSETGPCEATGVATLVAKRGLKEEDTQYVRSMRNDVIDPYAARYTVPML
jgi:hypothetical protein